MNRYVRTLAPLAVLVAGLASAQPSQLRNARLKTDASRDSLEQRIDRITRSANEPVWIAYEIPLAVPNATMCCYTYHDSQIANRGVCNLEREGSTSMNDDGNPDVERAGFLFLRYEKGAPSRIRVFSDDCAVDAGNREVYLLTEVDPAQSVAMLARDLSDRDSRRHLESQRLHAIAMHRGTAAINTLDRVALSSADEETRGHALFWLAQVGGQRGFETIRRVARNENDSEDVREKAVFAITQSPVAGATEELIDLARHAKDPEIRSKALFWLSQKAGKKAAAALKGAVDDDPDEDVKEKAVFAISQLPADESVPMLIELARTNKNAGVRTKAMFWLGQSNDERALNFFEKVLSE